MNPKKLFFKKNLEFFFQFFFQFFLSKSVEVRQSPLKVRRKSVESPSKSVEVRRSPSRSVKFRSTDNNGLRRASLWGGAPNIAKLSLFLSLSLKF